MSLRHRMANTADAGLAFATQVHGQDSSLAGCAIPRHQTSVGFTPPVAIYDRMDETNADAHRLDSNIRRYVRDPEGDFTGPWNAWLSNWRRFYDKYKHAGGKISAAFRSDELDAEARKFHSELESFYESYNRQTSPSGQPVPPLTGPAPVGETLQTGFGLPWWFWTLSGVALVGAGYIVYRKYQEGRAKARYIHRHAPTLLERYIPGFGKPAYEFSQAGRDETASSDPSYALTTREKVEPTWDPIQVQSARDVREITPSPAHSFQDVRDAYDHDGDW